MKLHENEPVYNHRRGESLKHRQCKHVGHVFYILLLLTRNSSRFNNRICQYYGERLELQQHDRFNIGKNLTHAPKKASGPISGVWIWASAETST